MHQVTLAEDVKGAANKLVILKTIFPSADVFSITAARPKMLLQSEERITEDAQQVESCMSRVSQRLRWRSSKIDVAARTETNNHAELCVLPGYNIRQPVL